jgi:hypothetical protein
MGFWAFQNCKGEFRSATTKSSAEGALESSGFSHVRGAHAVKKTPAAYAGNLFLSGTQRSSFPQRWVAIRLDSRKESG